MFVKLFQEKAQCGPTKKRKYFALFVDDVEKSGNPIINNNNKFKYKNDLYSELYNVNLPEKIIQETADYHIISYEKISFNNGMNIFDNFKNKIKLSLGILIHHHNLNDNNEKFLIAIENYLNCQINIYSISHDINNNIKKILDELFHKYNGIIKELPNLKKILARSVIKNKYNEEYIKLWNNENINKKEEKNIRYCFIEIFKYIYGDINNLLVRS